MPYPVTNSEQCPDLWAGAGTEGSNSQLLETERRKDNIVATSRVRHWEHDRLVMEGRLFCPHIPCLGSLLPNPAWNSAFI